MRPLRRANQRLGRRRFPQTRAEASRGGSEADTSSTGPFTHSSLSSSTSGPPEVNQTGLFVSILGTRGSVVSSCVLCCLTSVPTIIIIIIIVVVAVIHSSNSNSTPQPWLAQRASPCSSLWAPYPSAS